MSFFPVGFPAGTGFSWDTDDDEALPDNDKQVVAKYYCAEKGHRWADTGMKWTYCQECNAEGE